MKLNGMAATNDVVIEIGTDGTHYSTSGADVTAGNNISLYFKITLDATKFKSLSVDFHDKGRTNDDEEATLISIDAAALVTANPSDSFHEWNAGALTYIIDVIDDASINKNTNAIIYFTLANFTVTNLPGNYKCWFIADYVENESGYTPPSIGKDLTIVCQNAIEPTIVDFYSDKYFVIDGQSIGLSILIKGEGNIQYAIFNSLAKQILPAREGERLIATSDQNTTQRIRVNGNGIFELRVYFGTGSTEDYVFRQLYVQTVTDSTSRSYQLDDLETPPLAEKAMVMARIYPTGKQLFGIAFNKKNGTFVLYKSENGIDDWQLQYRRAIKGKFDVPTPVQINPEIAGSPAALFAGKLLFTGGSSYATPAECQNSNVYAYDLTGKTMALQSGNAFTARMGHACIVQGEEIWVMGGYNSNSDYGTLNDIWISRNGINWLKSFIKLPSPNGDAGRCMMAATTWNNHVWIYGGFRNEPNGACENSMYFLDGTNWQLVTPDPDILPKSYNNVAFAVLNGNLFLFIDSSIYRIFKDNSGSYKCSSPITTGFVTDQMGSLQLTAIATNYGTGNEQEARIAMLSFAAQSISGAPYDLNDNLASNIIRYFNV